MSLLLCLFVSLKYIFRVILNNKNCQYNFEKEKIIFYSLPYW